MKTIGRVEEDRCPCQKEKQNASHLILYCRKYSVEREALRQALPVSSITILHILFSTKKRKEALSSFLTSTGICTKRWYTREEEQNEDEEMG
jgi:hypothetical protein